MLADRSRAVAIVSGGLDSTVLAYWMRKRWRQLHLISFDYGQRHKRELDYAAMSANRLGARWTKIDLEAAGVTSLLHGSALTDKSVAVPDGHYAEPSMKATIVPNRNAIMLSIAVAAAVADGAEVVGIAVHAGDHAIYPDCRYEFIQAFEEAMEIGNSWSSPIHILTPFIHDAKERIVTQGAELGVPFVSTWSCYKGDTIHCGSCGTCVERREAFQLAGIEDPTLYAASPAFPAPTKGEEVMPRGGEEVRTNG